MRMINERRAALADLGSVVLIALFASAILALCIPASAHAQSYKTLDFPKVEAFSDYSGVEEAFGRYYKCSKNWSLYLSTEENGPWEKTGMSNSAVVSEDKIYEVQGKNLQTLYVYDIKKKTKRKVMSFSKSCLLEAMYKNNAYLSYSQVFVNKQGEYDTKPVTIVCNINTKKIVAKIDKCQITSFGGNYATVTEMGGTLEATYLYKLTSSGVKKVRTVTKYGDALGIYNNRIYYLKYKNYSGFALKSPKLCTQKVTSSSESQIASLKDVYLAYPAGEDGCIVERYKNSKSSFVSVSYSTGELSKIS